MSERLSARELIEVLKAGPADLPIVLRIEREASGETLTTFVTRVDVSIRSAYQTYLGDLRVLRLSFEQDEP